MTELWQHNAKMAMNKQRRLIFVGAAAAAAAAGAGLALTQNKRGPVVDDDPPVDLWSLRLPRPDGGELVMADFRGQPLLINFWATWCAPCVRELPEIDRFARDQAASKLRVVGLALDKLAAVQDFVKRLPLTMPVAVAGMQGGDLVRTLGNPQGGLPFTVLLLANGQVGQRKLGETSYAELAVWTKSL